MDLSNTDLWIIGDSFTANGNAFFWPRILERKFIGENKFLNSTDCKDTQTIMDLFYKNTYNISKNSLVLIFLPSLARIRFPKKKNLFDKSFETINIIKNNTNKKVNFNELFVQWPYHNFPSPKGKSSLDFPFDTFDYSGHLGFQKYYVELYYYTNKELWKDSVIGRVNNFDFSRLINANDSTTQNWNDIFYSIKKTFDFNIEFFSWTDEFDSNVVWTKEKIKNEIGFWHTLNDVYIETDGKEGSSGNEHFSNKMHEAFSNMIINKYSEHFK